MPPVPRECTPAPLWAEPGPFELPAGDYRLCLPLRSPAQVTAPCLHPTAQARLGVASPHWQQIVLAPSVPDSAGGTWESQAALWGQEESAVADTGRGTPSLPWCSSGNGTGRAGAGGDAGTTCTAAFSRPELVALPRLGRQISHISSVPLYLG